MSRASSSVGSGLSSRPAVIVVRKPGVQKPHWSAWQSWNACCTGPSVPSAFVSPSTVVIRASTADTANIRQARTGSPSISTVQAPQTPCSQPTWVPVRPTSWRSASESSRRAGTRTSYVAPLTWSRTSKSSSPLLSSLMLAGSTWNRQPAGDFVGCSCRTLLRVVVGPPEYAGGQHAHQLLTVGAGGVDVGRGIELRERRLGCTGEGVVVDGSGERV